MVHQHVITMSFVKLLVPEGGGGGKKDTLLQRAFFTPRNLFVFTTVGRYRNTAKLGEVR